VLRRKFAMPAETIDGIEHLLREYHVEPKPRELPRLKLDHNDLLVVASALNAAADILITRDQDLLNIGPKALKVFSPREFWDTQRQRRSHRKPPEMRIFGRFEK
jgi:predicted nucleic acid-binding protein